MMPEPKLPIRPEDVHHAVTDSLKALHILAHRISLVLLGVFIYNSAPLQLSRRITGISSAKESPFTLEDSNYIVV
jgi:hypothetical protein